MLALYDICAGDSHRLIIVKEISAYECHLHKGNSVGHCVEIWAPVGIFG